MNIGFSLRDSSRHFPLFAFEKFKRSKHLRYVAVKNFVFNLEPSKEFSNTKFDANWK